MTQLLAAVADVSPDCHTERLLLAVLSVNWRSATGLPLAGCWHGKSTLCVSSRCKVSYPLFPGSLS